MKRILFPLIALLALASSQAIVGAQEIEHCNNKVCNTGTRSCETANLHHCIDGPTNCTWDNCN